MLSNLNCPLNLIFDMIFQWFFKTPMRLPIVDKELKDHESGRQLAVTEYSITEKGPITISNYGNTCEIKVDSKQINSTPKILGFKETAADSNKFDHIDLAKVFYEPADLVTLFNNHKIDKEMVTKALNVCHETYDNTWDAINPRDLPEDRAKQERMRIGNTRCVFQHYPQKDTLYIGFRGSADKNDWLSNLQFELVPMIAGRRSGEKVHKGFKERSDNILNKLPKKILKYDPLPKIIVTCGHSLGAAISQLIHIQLEKELNMDSSCNLINITFAPPMVGNLHLRNSFNLPYAKNLAEHMYHFVLAEDIVPAALFTEYTRENIHMYDWVLRKIIHRYLGGEHPELAQAVIDQLGELKTPERDRPVFSQDRADKQYAPIGNQFYIKECFKLNLNSLFLPLNTTFNFD